jgi:hypothetical protein
MELRPTFYGPGLLGNSLPWTVLRFYGLAALQALHQKSVLH